MVQRTPFMLERIGRGVAAVVVAVLVVGSAGRARAEASAPPQRMAYHPDQPIPAGYHVEHRTRYGLVITGSILFGITYVPTFAAAFLDSRDGTPLYVVPILGPLFAIPGKTSHMCSLDDSTCGSFDDLVTAFLVADALVQATGVLVAWKGFLGRDLLIRDEPLKAALVPGRIGADGYGAWLTGRF